MKKLLPFLLLLACFTSCRKEKKQPVNIDCAAFRDALVADDYVKIAKQINIFFASRTPEPGPNDEFGYKKIYQEWLNQIDDCQDLKVLSSCYECFQTYPSTSSASVEIDYNGQIYTKSIYTSYHLDIKFYGQ